jgi:LytR cell envelope-related transcriptional attenuator
VEQRPVIWRLVVLGAVVAVLAGAALVMARQPGVRIRVQVLNATAARGLARRATGYLRDRGFDVVDVATAPQPRDSTLVIDRSGHPEWAQLVARALGGAAVESHLDSSRYLDVTVLVGRDWTPPADPFYP